MRGDDVRRLKAPDTKNLRVYFHSVHIDDMPTVGQTLDQC